MSLLDRVRPSRPQTPPDEVDAWWQPAVSGALTAAGSWLVLALPALLVWVFTEHTTVGWGEAMGVASAGWFLAHGAPVSVGATSVSVAPLGLTFVVLAVTVHGLRRLLDRTEAQARGTRWPLLLVRRLVPGFLTGYAVFALAAWLVTLASPARPSPVSVLVTLASPLLATAWCLVRRHTGGEESGPVGRWVDSLPRWLVRGVGPGLWGAAALLGLGTVLVLGMVAARASTVAGLYTAVGAGLFGGVVLTLGQLVLLPNLALWALSWLAGPGFSIADGSSVTVAGAHPGLLPLIPVLGALPVEGTWSRWLLLVLALPVAVGALVARRSCRTMARLASWRSRLATAAWAVATSGIVVGVLVALSNGSAGIERLRHVGPPALTMTGALVGELLLGAVLYVVVGHVWLRWGSRLRWRPRLRRRGR